MEIPGRRLIRVSCQSQKTFSEMSAKEVLAATPRAGGRMLLASSRAPAAARWWSRPPGVAAHSSEHGLQRRRALRRPCY